MYENGLFQVKLAQKAATVATRGMTRTTMTRSTTAKRSARTLTKNFLTRGADQRDTTATRGEPE